MKKSLSQHKSRRTKIPDVSYFVKIGGIIVVLFFLLNVGTYVTNTFNQPCANSESCLKDVKDSVENGTKGIFQDTVIPVPTIIESQDASSVVLGVDDPQVNKHIYVDLSKQKIYAFEGETVIFETLVSTGRWGRTPTGNFNIWSKLRSTRMSGGSGSDYYNLPNVPFTMYFYRDFGLHGAYWHNNFGYTMSHGCVNLRQIDAEVLFNWADGPTGNAKGTPVSVCDRFTTPSTCEMDNPVQI